jgi:hypothetical protein
MKAIVSPRTLSELLGSKDASNFLQESNRTVGCIDGRVLPEGCLGLAGSGILLQRDADHPDLPAERYLRTLSAMVENGELEGLTWHRGHGGCGAAGIHLRSTGIANPTEREIERAAREFTETLGAELSRRARRRVAVWEADAPGAHGELGAYVDFTNKLDLMPEREPGRELPGGFMISPRLTNDLSYVVQEIGVAISIAFGGHGRGAAAFNKEDPFFVLLLDCQGNPLTVAGLPDMIHHMVLKDYPQLADKIAVRTVLTVA